MNLMNLNRMSLAIKDSRKRSETAKDALDFYMEMEIATFPTLGGARASRKAAANETTLQLQ